MKKLFSLLLILAVLMGIAALAGCGTQEGFLGGNPETEPVDLHTLVSEAKERTTNATYVSARMNLNMKVDAMGDHMDVGVAFTIKADMTDPEKPIIGLDAAISSLQGEQISYGYYYDGQWMYQAINGEGYKIKATLEEFRNEAVDTDNLLVDLPEELFDGITATTVNGVTKVELTAESETFKKLYEDMLEQILSDAANNYDIAMEVDDARIAIAVADGYLKSYDLSFKVTCTLGDEYAIYDLTMSMIYDSVNEKLTITPPEGYEDFTELGDA